MEKVQKTEPEWRAELSPEEYEVLREKGTERAFTGAYWDNKDDGVYRCSGCGAELFAPTPSSTPAPAGRASTRPLTTSAVATEDDRSFFMKRTEVNCSRCGGHLGHVFDDGPNPTGLRYCINSCSLDFDPKRTRTRRSSDPIEAGAPASTSAAGSAPSRRPAGRSRSARSACGRRRPRCR